MARLAGLALAGLLIAGPAFAADATAPVVEVMKLTQSNWADDGSDFQPLFSDERLAQLYSRDFRALFAEASKSAFASEAGTPFDYDVIVNAQDGCPLKDIAIAAEPGAGPPSVVVARYRFLTCFGSEPEYQAVSETRFDVVEENGRVVIDDIHTADGDGAFGSLKDEMKAIAAETGN
ncbi:hypothetical protein AB7M35_002461 [Amorphus suaedae]